jgi:hypothetical protein
MLLRSTLAVAVLLSTASLADTAFAGADDYAFEPVKSPSLLAIADEVIE